MGTPRRLFVGFVFLVGFVVAGAGALFGLAILNQTNTTAVLSYGIWDYTTFDLTAELEGASTPVSWSTSNVPAHVAASFNAGANTTATLTLRQLDNGPNAGTYTMYVTAQAASGESTQITLTLTVTPRALTLGGTFTAQNKVYDATTAATINTNNLTIVDGDILDGDIVSFTPTLVFSNANVGNSKTVTVSSTSQLSGAQAGNYTLSVSGAPTATANITKKPLTITPPTFSKIYDGNTSATATGSPTLVGVESGDTVTVTGSPTYTYAQETVGGSIGVTASVAYGLGGSSAGNYSVTQPTLTGAITQRPLNLTFTGTSRAYDATTAATVTVASDDRVTGDVLGTISASTANFTQTSVGTSLTINISGISADGADAGNYSMPSSATTTADITYRQVTIAGTLTVPTTRVYDRTAVATITDASTLTLVNVVPSEAADVVLSTPVAAYGNKSVGTGKTVSLTSASLSGSAVANYELSLTGAPTATAAITAKPLAVTFSTPDRTYDGTTSAATTFSDDRIANDSFTVTGTATFDTKHVGTSKTVTATGIALSGTDAANYSPNTSATTTASITARSLVVTVTGGGKVYDGTTTAPVTYVDNRVTNDVFTVSGTATYATKGVGTGKPISVSGMSLSGTDAANYTANTTTSGSGNITARTLTVGVNATSKTYDGTTAVTVAYTDNRASGDSLTITGTASFASKTVAANKTVNATSISVTGSDAGNYTWSTTATGTATISARSLTVGITTTNKQYDGNTSATVTYTDNRVSSDSLSITGSAAFDTKAIGTGKTVTASSISVTGTDSGNYTWNTTATGNANITAKTVTIVGTYTGSNRAYDGTTNATSNVTVPPSPTLSGVVSGDNVTLTGTPTFTFASANVGTGIAITGSGYSLGGTDGANYVLTQPSTSANITTRTVTLGGTLTVASTRVYDGTVSATVSNTGTLTLSNVASADAGNAAKLAIATVTAQYATKTVGSGKAVSITAATLSGTSVSNYVVSVSGAPTATAAITTRTLNVTATGTNRTYDRTNTATVTLANDKVSGDVLTVSYTSATFADKNVGVSKPISVSGISISGTDSGNYTVSSTATSSATISARSITVSITASNKVYDGTNAATVTYGDTRLSSDVLTVSGTATFANKNVGVSKQVTASGITLSGTDAGNYSPNATATNTATITARTLTVNISSTGKVYDGTTAATVTYTDDRVSGDVLTVSGTATYASKTVGTGKTITASSISVSGTDSGNYTWNTTKTTTADITIRSLVVSITANNKTYDATTAATVTYASNKVAADVLTITGSASFDTKTIGTGKQVTATSISVTGTDAGNYTWNTTATNTANITARLLTIIGTYTASNRTYDGTTAATGNVSVSASPTLANVQGSDAVSLTGTPTFTFASANVGNSITITTSGYSLTGADAGNYTLSLPGLAANITSRSVTVTGTLSVASSKTYNQSASASILDTSLLTLDNVAAADAGNSARLALSSHAAAYPDKNVGTNRTVSLTSASLTGTASSNYTLSLVGAPTATSSIVARSLTVSITANNKVYNSSDAATVSYSDNRISSDSISIAGTATFSDASVGNNKQVTANSIVVTGTDAGNYTWNTTATNTANITSRSLTITGTFTASNKVYDGTTAANDNMSVPVSPGLSGVQGSDDVTLAGSPTFTFSQATVGTNLTISTTGYTLAGTTASNYTLVLPTYTASITTRTVTIGGTLVVSSTKTYDRTTSISITDTSQLSLVNVPTADAGAPSKIALTSVVAQYSSKTVATGKSVSISSATLTGTTSSNYSLSLVGAPTTTADITARALTVTITATSKTYNASDVAIVTYADNRISNDSLTVSGTATFSDKNVGTGKTVTATGITLSGADAGNYSQNTTATNTANITARALTVTGTFTVSNRAYDATTAANDQVTPPASPGLSDVQVGDDATLTGTPTFTFARATIGTSIGISTTGYSVSGADAGNYALTQPSFSANITARPLTVGGSLVVSSTKVYDRTTAITITDSSQLTLVNVPAGDAGNASKVALTSLVATYANKNVGSAKLVSLTSASLTGTTSSNYTLSLTGAPTSSADITAKPITVSITPSNKTYDQTTTASVTYSDTRISGDSVTVSGTATFSDKNVGNSKQVTATGITLGGADAGNYSQNTTATNTANITARAMTVSITAANKVYDRTTAASVTYADTRIAGDDLTVTGTATFANKLAANGKTVTASGITLSGPDAGNYSYNTTATNTANITKKTLTVTISALNKTYDRGTSVSVTYLDDRITNDVLTVTGTASFSDKTVATGKTVTATGISISGTDAGNYTQNTTATTTADITAKPLTVTITASNKVYNASNVASVTYSDTRITSDILTVTGTATFDDKTAANGKTVTANGITLSGADAGNYSYNTTATTQANITKRPLTVTGTFTVANREYDATTDATPQVTLPVSAGLSDVQVGDDAMLTGTPTFTFAQATVGTGIAISTSGYSVSGADAANYQLTQPSFTANITTRPLTIGGSLVVAASKTYDKGMTSTITSPASLTLVNVPSGDANNAAKVALTSLTATYGDKNVGTGKAVTLATASLTGTTASNYTLSLTGAPSTTANITARPLSVTITATSRTYNQSTAASVTYSDNRLSSDVLTVSGTATFSDKNVGTGKTVTASGITLSGTDAGNYTPNSTATNTANITAKTLAVTISASDKVYDALTAATVTYSDDRISGDDFTVSGTANFNNKNVGTGKQVTATGITLSGTDAGNYTPNSTTTTTASITLRTLSVTATASNKVYDGSNAATVSYADDRRPSDILTITGTATFDSKDIGAGKPVSISAISVTGTDSGNYTWNTTTSSSADVTIRTLTVTAAADTKVYDALTTATAVYSDNRVSGDSLTITGTASFATKVVGTAKPVSITGISVTGTDAGNYTWNTTTSSSADITQRPLQVTGSLQALDKVYDGTRTATYTLADLQLVGVQGSDAVGVSNPRGRFRTNANVGVSKTVELTSYQLTGADLGNYAVTVDNSPITYASITARPLTVSITATSKVYDANNTASVTYSDDRVSGDVFTVSGTATFSDKNVGTSKTVTATDITLNGTAAGNYSQNTTATNVANITPKPLAVTITTSNKVYDGSTAAPVTYVDNRISGDDFTVSGTATFANKVVGTGKPVTASSITLSGTDAGNYNPNTSTTGTAAITARPLTVTISASNKTYDRSTTASVTYSDDRVSGDLFTVSGTATFSDKNVGVGKTVTASGISLSGTDAGNYSRNTTATTTADITAKALVVTISASNKTYDANDVASVTYSDDRIANDVFTVSGTATFSDKTAANGKTVTASSITLSGTDAGNYSQNTTATTTGNIAKRTLTVTGTFTVANRAYDATTDATPQVTLPVTAGLSAVQGADDTTLIGTPTFTFAQATVGTNIAITTTGYSLDGVDATNYLLTQPSFVANITARPLTISGSFSVSSSKVYDRTVAATITDSTQLSLVNVPSGDANNASKVALTSLVAQYATKGVADNKTVSVTSAALTGTTSSNYTLSLSGAPTTTANITAKSLSVTVSALSKVYDQSDAASVTYSDDRIANDVLTVSGTAVFSDKNVGVGKTVTASGITLSGADAGNYSQNTTASTTATISRKPLVVTISALNKTYDRSTAASVTYADDRISGDSLTVSGTAVFSDKNVGVGKTVTASGISLSGADAGNYSQNNTASTTATISRKPLVVTITAVNKTYDRSTAASVTYADDRITNDVFTVSGTAVFSDKNVGVGKSVTASGITLSGTDAGNYSQNASAITTADITAKSLNVTVSALSKVYDQSDSASVTYADDRIANDVLTVSGSAAFSDKNVGVGKSVTASGISLSGADAGNYSQNTTASTTATISRKPLVVTISALNKTYDRSTAASVSYADDRMSGDLLTVSGSAAFSDKNVGVGKSVTASGISLSGADAGNYSQNTSATTTATITAKPLVVTMTAVNKTYDRNTAASVTYADDRLSGDSLTVSGTAAFSDKNVGVGKTVTASGISLSGADAGNYSQNTSATTTADITAKSLTVTVSALSKVYDQSDSASVTYSDDRIANDSFTVSGSAAFSDKNVGVGKSVTASGITLSGADAGNYSQNTTASTTATITAKPLVVTISALNKVYDSNTSVVVTYADDRLSGDDLTVSGSASFNSDSVGTGKSVTASGITLSGADAGNYSQNTTASTTANITAKPLTVTISASNKVYDGSASATVSLADNRTTGDIFTIAYSSSVFDNKNVGSGKLVTVSGISLSGVDSANYVPNTTATTTANITRRSLAIGIVADDKVYDAGTAATVVYTDNRVSGDQFAISGTANFADKTAAAAKIVTSSGIAITGVDADNYSHSTTATTTAAITRRPLVVTAAADSKRYDATNVATVTFADDRLPGDSFTVSGVATFPDAELGTGLPVTVTGISLAGSDAANYTPNATTSSTADIFVRPITAAIPQVQPSKLLAVSRPTVQIGQLVPGMDTRVTFTKSGTTVECALLPTEAAASCVPDTLTDGTWSYRATQVVDGLMVAASPSITLTVDTTAPVLTRGPVMAASSNSGNKQDNVTNKNTPIVSIGEALSGETAVVTATSVSGAVQCSFAVTESTKECALPTLTDGSWSISARLTDAAGNTSPQSPAVDIVVDTVAPATPAAPLNAIDNGTGISTDLTPSIVVNGVADGDTVEVAGVLGGKPEATCSFVSSATVKSCDMPKMKGGTWTLSARATDIAGNVSPESLPTKLIISVAVIPRTPVQPVVQAPALNRSSSDVKLSFGQSAALAGVKMVTFVVTDANNKVVRKTTVKVNPEAKGAGIQIPTNLPGAKVQVFTGNECGVSPNAPDDMNIKRGKTATSVNKRGIPQLKGDMILPAVDFGPSEIELDREDKARLREVAKEVKGRCGTLFLSGFSRFNDKDSERYLQNLANFRAQAVADYLSSIGVKMWLVYQGFIVKSNDSTGLYRRVELRWEPA